MTHPSRFPDEREAITMEADIKRLRRLSMKTLVREYEVAFGKPPRVKHRAYLWKRIAWKREDVRTGGLSMVAKARLEELIAMLGIDFSQRTATGVLTVKPRLQLSPGTSIIRDYKGRSIRVTALDKGFQYEGEVYRSLSAVAKMVTGQHVNGRAFFGLNKLEARK